MMELKLDKKCNVETILILIYNKTVKKGNKVPKNPLEPFFHSPHKV